MTICWFSNYLRKICIVYRYLYYFIFNVGSQKSYIQYLCMYSRYLLDRWISFLMILGEKLEREENLEKKRKFSKEWENTHMNLVFWRHLYDTVVKPRMNWQRMNGMTLIFCVCYIKLCFNIDYFFLFIHFIKSSIDWT